MALESTNIHVYDRPRHPPGQSRRRMAKWLLALALLVTLGAIAYVVIGVFIQKTYTDDSEPPHRGESL